MGEYLGGGGGGVNLVLSYLFTYSCKFYISIHCITMADSAPGRGPSKM